MRKAGMLVAMAILVTSAALGALACSDGGDGGDGGGGATPTAPVETAISTPTTPQAGAATVGVKLTEWIVAPAPSTIAAGAITFNAENIGGNRHMLMILQTSLAPEALPAKDDGSFDEAGPGVQVVGQIQELQSKGTGSVTAELEPGAYVLICNVVDQSGSHYKSGMRAAFQVTP